MVESLTDALPRIQKNEIYNLRLSLGSSIFSDAVIINDDANLEDAGRIIMANTSIKNLNLDGFCETSSTQCQSLFRGISENKSIKYICIARSDVCEELSKVSYSECLNGVMFRNCNILIDVFAAVFARGHALPCLEIHCCTFILESRPPLVKRAKLEPITKRIHLSCLVLDGNTMDQFGCEAVAKLLFDVNTTIKKIRINNREGQEWHSSFFRGLGGCKSLEKLQFNSAERDLSLLASALSKLTLRELDLSQSQINADGARALSDVMSQNNTVQVLMFRKLRTTQDALAMIMPALGRTSALRSLCLHDNDLSSDTAMLLLADALANNSTLEKLNLWESSIDDDGITALANALSGNETLEDLNLNTCMSVTTAGWIEFSRVLGSSRSALKKLNLSNNFNNDVVDTAIYDEIIALFANGLIGNETLEELNLWNSHSVTANGWIAFSRVLGSHHSALKKLDLSNNYIDDDVVTAFANELRGNENSQLAHLEISGFNLSVTNVGWDSILNLLNNPSSIDATWSSNHTLTYLCPFDYDDSDLESDDEEDSYPRSRSKMPMEIYDLLEMNDYGDKNEVAREKVIENHFSSDFDVNVILSYELKLLPHAVSWFGRDRLGYSAVYQIIRTTPELCQKD